jgi:Holliday junction resolvase
MHSKAKGNIGEMAVAKDLMLKGYAVFTELGDLSKVDLIAIKEGDLKKIQVKTQWDTSDGKIYVSRVSSGPGYRYHYTTEDIDVMAAYAADRDVVVYVPLSQIVQDEQRSFVIRFDPPKSNQAKGIRLVENFLTI